MQISFNFEVEADDLRKVPIEGSRGSLSAYVAPTTPPKTTAWLPKGTQSSFIEATAAAATLGFPINTLLTIRWDSLFSSNDVNHLRPLTVPERIDRLVELLRKKLKWHEIPPAYIWVREATRHEGEHWHLAFHLPKSLHPQIIDFVAKQTEEPARPYPRRGTEKTEGEFASGEIGSWHLAYDTEPLRKGFYIAAYLGKAEPSEVMFRGKMVGNKKKPVRGIEFGGTERTGKYDADQGTIIGTTCRKDRFFISTYLQRGVKAHHKAKRSKPVSEHKAPTDTQRSEIRKRTVSQRRSDSDVNCQPTSTVPRPSATKRRVADKSAHETLLFLSLERPPTRSSSLSLYPPVVVD